VDVSTTVLSINCISMTMAWT